MSDQLRIHNHAFPLERDGDRVCIGPCTECGASPLDELAAQGWQVESDEVQS
jgi:hypothetical protein